MYNSVLVIDSKLHLAVLPQLSPVAFLLLGELGDAPPLWIFLTIWAMALPPPLGCDFLGEDYGLFQLFWARSRNTLFCATKKLFSLIF